MKVVIAVTGSSGAVFALDFMKKCPGKKFLVMSAWGRVVFRDELGMGEKDLKPFVTRTFSDDDLAAPIASGSNALDAMVIVPASASTVGKIASGVADTLITRAAQVCLKERYRLIVCIRETPLSTLTLEQCARLSSYGAVIMPVSPPLYFSPGSVAELVSGYTDKILAQLGVRTSPGWRAEELE